MKRMLAIMLSLLLMLPLASALAENEALLGQRVPDFTVTTAAGEEFSLAQAVEEKGVVLINLFATWCGPCRMEFPALNEAYLKYADRVAVIALSIEPNDTLDVLSQYQKENGLDFPVSRDPDRQLINWGGFPGVPATIMVDRFGNAAYMHVGAMFSSGAFERLFDYFLSEDYTETAAINALPAPLGAPAYTPAENWGVKAENGRAVGMRLNGEALDLASWIQSIYVIEADTADLSFSVPAGADLDLTMVVDSMGAYHPLSAVLTGDGDFRLAMPLSLDADSAYEYAVLVTPENDEYGALIFHSEAEADLTVEALAENGEEIDWYYLDAE